MADLDINDVDLYIFLGVDMNATTAVIAQAWRYKARELHPDKAGANYERSQWDILQKAYEVLTNEDKRASYDAAHYARLKRLNDRLEREQNRLQRRLKEIREIKEDEMGATLAAEERNYFLSQQRKETERRAKLARYTADLEKKFAADEDKRRKAEDEKRKREKAAKIAKDLKEANPAQSKHGLSDMVPGNYVVQAGGVKMLYWQLEMNKLRAMQKVRDLKKRNATTMMLHEAEQALIEIRQQILDARSEYSQSRVKRDAKS